MREPSNESKALPPCPQAVWSTLDEETRIRVTAARTVRSAEFLTGLSTDPEWAVRREVAGNVHTPPEVRRALAQQLQEQTPPAAALRWEDRDAVLALPVKELNSMLADPHCPNWLLQLGSEHADARVRAPLALRIPSVRLAHDRSSVVRAAVASAPQIDVRLWSEFAKDPAVRVRRAVALNRGCPYSILCDLVGDPDANVRAAVARSNASFAPLLKDPDPVVRREVAGHEGAAPETLELLAKDQDSGVRLAVAQNPHCPWPVSTALCQDPGPKVRAAASHSVETREGRLHTLRGEQLWRALVARNGRPQAVETWPAYGWDRLFTVESCYDGYGSCDTHLRSSRPQDLLPSGDHLRQTSVFWFTSYFPVISWMSLVNEAYWERPGDIPHLSHFFPGPGAKPKSAP